MKIMIDKAYWKIKNLINELHNDNSGIGVVEVVLILVVLVGLVALFKEQITNLMTGIFERITTESTGL